MTPLRRKMIEDPHGESCGRVIRRFRPLPGQPRFRWVQESGDFLQGGGGTPPRRVRKSADEYRGFAKYRLSGARIAPADEGRGWTEDRTTD